MSTESEDAKDPEDMSRDVWNDTLPQPIFHFYEQEPRVLKLGKGAKVGSDDIQEKH